MLTAKKQLNYMLAESGSHSVSVEVEDPLQRISHGSPNLLQTSLSTDAPLLPCSFAALFVL